MIIHTVSDLHLEFLTYRPSEASNQADVIVLPGDVWTKDKGFAWARSAWPNKRIIYVAGNHEFYGEDWLTTLKAIEDSAKIYNIDFLNDTEVVIDDTRFLGATLWTDFKLFGEDVKYHSMAYARKNINDYRVIKKGLKTFTPQDSIDLHEQSVQWLQIALKKPFVGHTVVVTHHLPSMHSVAVKWKSDALSPCFASRLDHLINSQDVQLWLHGHTHDSFDYRLNGTRVVCNPRGYTMREGQEENRQFNQDLLIHLV